MAKFVDPGTELDLGSEGYSIEMTVIAVHAVTAEWLEEKQMGRMQAQALLDNGAWHVHCAENQDGSGLVDDIWLHEDDAAHFSPGDRIVHHYRRNTVPGYGQLAYIEREPKIIAPAI